MKRKRTRRTKKKRKKKTAINVTCISPGQEETVLVSDDSTQPQSPRVPAAP